MTLQLVALIVLLVIATSSAAFAYVATRPRTALLARIAGQPVGITPTLLPGASIWARFGDRITHLLPSWILTSGTQKNLIQAGYMSNAAAGWYSIIRVVVFLALPTVAYLLLQGSGIVLLVSGIVVAAIFALLVPVAWVEHRRNVRQDAIRKAIPDSLDLMLVCVEAGVSLDAAILRVGRELTTVHPVLAEELLLLNRRQNAGMSRDDALRGLFDRTGVEELRTLAASIAQSERWGTSMSRVLKVTSESLRRQRRQRCEKRAALAGTKMVFPLALLILPALLAVIYGPAYLTISEVFSEAAK